MRGLELRNLLPGRPRARRVPPQGGASPLQHLSAIGRLREVEGGGSTVPLLWERQVRSEPGRALGTHFSIPPTPGRWRPPTCMCCMAWEVEAASSRVTVQPPKPPPVMRLP